MQSKSHGSNSVAENQLVEVDYLIVGAGIAGLSLATELQAQGYKVQVIEKARGSGGRLSSKRLTIPKTDETETTEFSFDLGATHFEATHPTFQSALRTWQAANSVTHLAESDNTFIGTPRNSSLTRHLANSLNVDFSTRANHIEKHQPGWLVHTEQTTRGARFPTDKPEPNIPAGKSYQADWLILTAPPEQSHDLLPENHPLREQLSQYTIQAQWVMLLVIKSESPINPRAFDKNDSPIKQISIESDKRELTLEENISTLQIQATEAWTQQHLNDTPEDVGNALIQALGHYSDQSFEVIKHHTHRWLYATPSPNNPKPDISYLISNDQVGICGDYLGQGLSPHGVEAAYLSAKSLTEKLTTKEKNPETGRALVS